VPCRDAVAHGASCRSRQLCSCTLRQAGRRPRRLPATRYLPLTRFGFQGERRRLRAPSRRCSGKLVHGLLLDFAGAGRARRRAARGSVVAGSAGVGPVSHGAGGAGVVRPRLALQYNPASRGTWSERLIVGTWRTSRGTAVAHLKRGHWRGTCRWLSSAALLSGLLSGHFEWHWSVARRSVRTSGCLKCRLKCCTAQCALQCVLKVARQVRTAAVRTSAATWRAGRPGARQLGSWELGTGSARERCGSARRSGPSWRDTPARAPRS